MHPGPSKGQQVYQDEQRKQVLLFDASMSPAAVITYTDGSAMQLQYDTLGTYCQKGVGTLAAKPIRWIRC